MNAGSRGDIYILVARRVAVDSGVNLVHLRNIHTAAIVSFQSMAETRSWASHGVRVDPEAHTDHMRGTEAWNKVWQVGATRDIYD